MSRGLLYIDVDGTAVPDSELRNQRVIQATLDFYAVQAGRDKWDIDWKKCCGHSEANIHKILELDGFHGLSDIVSAEEFQATCKDGFEKNEPDYTPRPDIIETIITLKHFDVNPVIVSNSESDRVDLALKEAFNIAAPGISMEETLPIRVTKDDFAPNQLQAKPNPDPYWYAQSLAFAEWGVTPRDKVMVLEDSPPGVTSAYEFIHNPDQIIQFTDVGAPEHEHSTNHMSGKFKAHASLTESHKMMCERFDISYEAFTDKFNEVKASMRPSQEYAHA